MKIVLLTSSRADYGIYRSLLQQLHQDTFFELQIIAFGTHLSAFHGFTLNAIIADGFEVKYTIESMILGDSAEAVATAMAVTTMKFASLWATLQKETDLLICLGDRYEMFAAVSASIPFNIPVAHLYGGETTLGAIDNKFRHSITHMSQYHFTATAQYAQRVARLIGSEQGVYNVGSLSLDNLEHMKLLNIEKFKERYGIDMNHSTILVTFHPETVSATLNSHYADELTAALSKTHHQIVITMPNADTMGNIVRSKLLAFAQNNANRIFTVENLGTVGYFSCMKLCRFLLGNTSSGIIEAASFGKYVINIGNRQKGRTCSDNVLHVPIAQNDLLMAIQQVENMAPFSGINIYRQENVSRKIIDILKSIAAQTA